MTTETMETIYLPIQEKGLTKPELNKRFGTICDILLEDPEIEQIAKQVVGIGKQLAVVMLIVCTESDRPISDVNGTKIPTETLHEFDRLVTKNMDKIQQFL
jgi:hypothetical protein